MIAFSIENISLVNLYPFSLLFHQYYYSINNSICYFKKDINSRKDTFVIYKKQLDAYETK